MSAQQEDYYIARFRKELHEFHEVMRPDTINEPSAIRLTQELMWLAGAEAITIDGIWGPQTELFVTEFIRSYSLGETAWTYELARLLYAPIMDAFSHVPVDGVFGDIKSVLDVAIRHEAMGAQEIPDNSGPWVRKYMEEYAKLIGKSTGEGAPWCAGFVSHCIEQSNSYVIKKTMIPYTASVDKLVESAKEMEIFVDGGSADSWKKVRPGAIFVLRGEDPGDWIHTGFVRRVVDQGATKSRIFIFTTVEGNTNTPGARDGYDVKLRERKCFFGEKAKYDFLYPIRSRELVHLCKS